MVQTLNKIKISFLFLILCATAVQAAAERDSSLLSGEKIFRADSIRITGNKITEDDVILQELTFHPGDFVTPKILAYNKERIYSLSLFTDVKLYTITKDSLNIIVIRVEESWYIWPIPFVDIRDNMIKRTTYGVDLQFKNFRGMNETLHFTMGFGYDPSFRLSYLRPWLIRKENISLSAELYYKNAVNKSYLAEKLYGEVFYQKIISGSIRIGKRIGLFNETGIWGAYDYIETPAFIRGISASNERVDRVIRTGINYTFDTRDLKQFPDSGIFATGSFEHKGFGLNGINYNVLQLDLRNYNKVAGDLSAKWRLAARFAMGRNVPFYDYSFLGSGEKVRGHYNDLREGHYSYVASAELKYPIIKEWDFSIKLPLIPKSLTSYRIEVFTNLFGDTGAVQMNDAKLGVKDFYSGYGAGLIFLLLPYNIIRVEYALNELRQGELIFGFGFSF